MNVETRQATATCPECHDRGPHTCWREAGQPPSWVAACRACGHEFDLYNDAKIT